jgi:hypothetical protein
MFLHARAENEPARMIFIDDFNFLNCNIEEHKTFNSPVKFIGI